MKLLPLLLAALGVCACSGDHAPPAGAIRMSVLPDQSPAELRSRYQPLVDYLESVTGLDVELTLPATYDQLVEDFVAGRVDLAHFGGTTFVQAESRTALRPLVMRDIDLQFVSCYLVRSEDTREGIRDFRGEAFAFGPLLSTSGHVMPRYFLAGSGYVPDEFFGAVLHSASHDDTALRVVSGEAAIGVANCEIVIAMLGDGRLSRDDVRILESTPPYPDYVWAIAESVDGANENALRDAFLALDPLDPEHLSLLAMQGAGGYIPAGSGDFDELREAVAAAGSIPRSANR